jgi:hypothetical protein
LAQGGRRRHPRQTQRFLEETIASKAFDGIEVALALGEQADIAAHQGAGRQPAAARPLGVQAFEQGIEALEKVTNKGQTGHRRQVIVELLDAKSKPHSIPPKTHPPGEKIKELFYQFNQYKSTSYDNSACPRSRIQEYFQDPRVKYAA